MVDATVLEDTSSARAYERDGARVAGRGRGLRGVMEDVNHDGRSTGKLGNQTPTSTATASRLRPVSCPVHSTARMRSARFVAPPPCSCSNDPMLWPFSNLRFVQKVAFVHSARWSVSPQRVWALQRCAAKKTHVHVLAAIGLAVAGPRNVVCPAFLRVRFIEIECLVSGLEPSGFRPFPHSV